MTTKLCTACNTELGIDNFRWRKNRSNFESHCKRCASMSNIYRTYGITIKDYDLLREAQGYSCAICDRHESEINTRGRTGHNRYRLLVIDHCHETDEVRGLLCHDCNVMLGNAKDDPDVLLKAVEYLRET